MFNLLTGRHKEKRDGLEGRLEASQRKPYSQMSLNILLQDFTHAKMHII